MAIISTKPKYEFAQKAVVNLKLSKDKGLKPVPQEIMDKCIYSAVDFVCSELNFENVKSNLSGSKEIAIFCRRETDDPEEITNEILDIRCNDTLKKIGARLNSTFSTTIENETGESRSRFFRTVTWFESQSKNGVIRLYWS